MMDAPQFLILNVDDQETARYPKTRALQRAGYTVIEAATGREALQKVEEKRPAAVLLDVRLPDINGFEVCSIIKEKWPEVMVLQTSATFTSGADRTRGLQGGADSYLSQPTEPEELTAAMGALMRIRRAEDELRQLNETLEQRVQERTRDLAESNQKLKNEISQRQRAEAALVQSQKMEAIGHLTGGIAHDFNNLLTAVVGNLDLIRSRASDTRVLRYAENAFKAAERGAKLTAQLLAFSRIQRLATTPIDVNALIIGMGELITQSIGPSIEVRTQLDPATGAAMGDANQLELAILNLAINARDAMPNGGSLTISTGTSAISAAEEGIAEGEYVSIDIADSGSGMASDVAARAFDPFFTTKPPGKGTGLGLSQVYGIAKQSGGDARLRSKLGAGTTVTLLLPRAIQPAIQSEATKQEPQAPDFGTIVVVDDDPDVRDLVFELLVGLGYDVHTADDGEAGLALLQRVVPDLLILDFAMPGINGAELARAARTRNPDLNILFLSGYADTSALEAAVGRVPLLRKPFRPVELAAAVRAVFPQAKR
jgi:DNA-binding response OmpR family regulator